jgi:hypothetical protein
MDVEARTKKKDGKRLPLRLYRGEVVRRPQPLVGDRVEADVVADEEGEVLGDCDQNRLGGEPPSRREGQWLAITTRRSPVSTTSKMSCV